VDTSLLKESLRRYRPKLGDVKTAGKA
jgi:hypothetical protein